MKAITSRGVYFMKYNSGYGSGLNHKWYIVENIDITLEIPRMQIFIVENPKDGGGIIVKRERKSANAPDIMKPATQNQIHMLIKTIFSQKIGFIDPEIRERA
jgi:hypothetical protein